MRLDEDRCDFPYTLLPVTAFPNSCAQPALFLLHLFPLLPPFLHFLLLTAVFVLSRDAHPLVHTSVPSRLLACTLYAFPAACCLTMVACTVGDPAGEWLQVQGKELPCSQRARPQGSAEGVWTGAAQGDHHPSPGLQCRLQVMQQLCLSSW